MRINEILSKFSPATAPIDIFAAVAQEFYSSDWVVEHADAIRDTVIRAIEASSHPEFAASIRTLDSAQIRRTILLLKLQEKFKPAPSTLSYSQLQAISDKDARVKAIIENEFILHTNKLFTTYALLLMRVLRNSQASLKPQDFHDAYKMNFDEQTLLHDLAKQGILSVDAPKSSAMQYFRQRAQDFRIYRYDNFLAAQDGDDFSQDILKAWKAFLDTSARFRSELYTVTEDLRDRLRQADQTSFPALKQEANNHLYAVIQRLILSDKAMAPFKDFVPEWTNSLMRAALEYGEAEIEKYYQAELAHREILSSQKSIVTQLLTMQVQTATHEVVFMPFGLLPGDGRYLTKMSETVKAMLSLSGLDPFALETLRINTLALHDLSLTELKKLGSGLSPDNPAFPVLLALMARSPQATAADRMGYYANLANMLMQSPSADVRETIANVSSCIIAIQYLASLDRTPQALYQSQLAQFAIQLMEVTLNALPDDEQERENILDLLQQSLTPLKADNNVVVLGKSPLPNTFNFLAEDIQAFRANLRDGSPLVVDRNTHTRYAQLERLAPDLSADFRQDEARILRLDFIVATMDYVQELAAVNSPVRLDRALQYMEAAITDIEEITQLFPDIMRREHPADFLSKFDATKTKIASVLEVLSQSNQKHAEFSERIRTLFNRFSSFMHKQTETPLTDIATVADYTGITIEHLPPPRPVATKERAAEVTEDLAAQQAEREQVYKATLLGLLQQLERESVITTRTKILIEFALQTDDLSTLLAAQTNAVRVSERMTFASNAREKLDLLSSLFTPQSGIPALLQQEQQRHLGLQQELEKDVVTLHAEVKEQLTQTANFINEHCNLPQTYAYLTGYLSSLDAKGLLDQYHGNQEERDIEIQKRSLRYIRESLQRITAPTLQINQQTLRAQLEEIFGVSPNAVQRFKADTKAATPAQLDAALAEVKRLYQEYQQSLPDDVKSAKKSAQEQAELQGKKGILTELNRLILDAESKTKVGEKYEAMRKLGNFCDDKKTRAALKIHRNPKLDILFAAITLVLAPLFGISVYVSYRLRGAHFWQARGEGTRQKMLDTLGKVGTLPIRPGKK